MKITLSWYLKFRSRDTKCAYVWPSSRPTFVLGLAPEVGFEPTTNRLTADRSTTELLWIRPCGRMGRAYTLFRESTAASRFENPISEEEIWLRGLDLNQRPSGYEPDELPGCSTPRDENTWTSTLRKSKKRSRSTKRICLWPHCDFVE